MPFDVTIGGRACPGMQSELQFGNPSSSDKLTLVAHDKAGSLSGPAFFWFIRYFRGRPLWQYRRNTDLSSHGNHGPPHPSLNLGSPPPTMWIANAEEENQQEVGGREPQSGCGAGFPCFLCFPWLIWVRRDGGSSIEAVDGLWEGRNCGCPLNRLPRNSRKNLFLGPANVGRLRPVEIPGDW